MRSFLHWSSPTGASAVGHSSADTSFLTSHVASTLVVPAGYEPGRSFRHDDIVHPPGVSRPEEERDKVLTHPLEVLRR